MPDRTKLRVGDRIKLIAVPEADLKQRDRERSEGLPDAGWTARTLELILKEEPVLTIEEIDEHGQPWFHYTLKSGEEHSIAIMDDKSWSIVEA